MLLVTSGEIHAYVSKSQWEICNTWWLEITKILLDSLQYYHCTFHHLYKDQFSMGQGNPTYFNILHAFIIYWIPENLS